MFCIFEIKGSNVLTVVENHSVFWYWKFRHIFSMTEGVLGPVLTKLVRVECSRLESFVIKNWGQRCMFVGNNRARCILLIDIYLEE
jgi:hypothetical protein